jgi:16S rRNA (uracil1498-N3)-methyltransferase
MISRAFYPHRTCVGETIVFDGEQGHHFARVLRVRVGEEISVAANGEPFLGIVEDVDGKAGLVRVRITSAIEPHETATKVFLVQGLAKGDKVETVIQKCTEVGAAGFAIIGATRSVVRLSPDKADAKLERWRKIALEAASQSQRDIPPTVHYFENANTLKPWLAELQPDAILFLDEDERALGLRNALQRYPRVDSPRTFVVVVGPEGGWDDKERSHWVEAFGALRISLGPRILRTETAGAVGVAAVLYEYGELGG